MAKVSDIVVPNPPALQTQPDGNVSTEGAWYTITAPANASSPVTITSSNGVALSMLPGEMFWYGKDSLGEWRYDYIVGSAPVGVSTKGTQAIYDRIFPEAQDVYVARGERIDNRTLILDQSTLRGPADYLVSDIKFGITWQISGITLPVGEHETVEASGFVFHKPIASDQVSAYVNGTYRVIDNGDDTQTLEKLFDAEWILSDERVGVLNIDPSVSTSTSSTATAYSNQRKPATFSNGVGFTPFYDGTGMVCRYSTDSGQTWQTPSTGATIATGFRNGSVRIVNDIVFAVLGDNAGDGDVYLYVGIPNAERTAYTWTNASATTAALAGYPDIAAHTEGSANMAHVIYSYADAANSSLRYCRWGVASDGTISMRELNTIIATAAVVSTHNYPSLAQLVTASKFLATRSTGQTGAGLGIVALLGTWASSAMTWGSAEAVDESNCAASGIIGSTGDSQGRGIVAYRRSSDNLLAVKRRSTSGTWSTLGTVPSVTPTSVSPVCDGDDVYVPFTDGTGVRYVKWNDSTGSWGSVQTVLTTISARQVSAQRSSDGTRIDWVATTDNGSSYSVVSGSISLNSAPTEPTLTASASAFDAGDGTAVTIQQNDTAGDSMSSFALKAVVDSVTKYWNDTTKALQDAEVYNAVAGTVTSYTISSSDLAGIFTNGTTPQLYASTKDAAGVAGPYNTTPLQLTVSAKPTYTISSPAASATLTGNTVTATWGIVSGTQGSYQLKLTAAGADPTTGTALGSSDTSEVTDASARSRTLTYTASNGDTVQVCLRVKNADGVWGDWIGNDNVTFSFTPVPTPTIAVTPNSASVRNEVQITNPAPTGSEPALSYNDLYRRVATTGTYIRIATNLVANATYYDYAIASCVTYEYYAMAVGANGTSANSTSATGSITIDGGFWLHDPTNAAATVHHFNYRENGLSETPAKSAVQLKLAGRSLPVTRFASTGTNELRVRVATPKDTTDEDALRAFLNLKKTLCYRDFRKRRMFVTMQELPINDERWGEWIDLRLTEVDYTEPV